MSSIAPDCENRPPFTGTRLSLMMFLQYAVWGIWLPIIGKYLTTPSADGGLGFSNTQMGWILGLSGSIGAVAAPFIAGQFADRIMNAERALGLLLIFGGVVKWITAYQSDYSAWLILSILYSVLYMPTLALTNSVAFANLRDPEKGFPFIRSWGTIGWIVASVAFPLLFMKDGIHVVNYWPFVDGSARDDEVSQIKLAMVASGIIAIAYGLYCIIVLPKTPPKPVASRPLAFAAAFKILSQPGFLAVMFSAVLISMIHQCYFFRTGNYITDHIGLPAGDIAPTMAIGQISEIVVLSFFGFMLKRIGYQGVLVIGGLSYALRYAIFGMTQSAMTMKLAMLLHGFNYGFFFAGSFMLIEKISPADIRHSTQTVFGILILGIGPVLAGFYNQWFERFTTTAGKFDYSTFWFVQSAIALLASTALLLAYSSKLETREQR